MSRALSYFTTIDGFTTFLKGLKWRVEYIHDKSYRKGIDRTTMRLGGEYADIALKNLSKIAFSERRINFANIQKEEVEAIIKKADRTLENYFDYLGSGEVKLEPVDWSLDFKSGHRWRPRTFYKDYVQEGIATNSDVKVPRELSRCHHLLYVGIAFQQTNDKKYARYIIEQIIDWASQNPLMYSINWGCTMDVAIRAVNWVWALSMIDLSDNATVQEQKTIFGTLYQHGWFIYRNPEKHNMLNNHNHYLADLAGQITLGMLFSNTKEGAKWLSKGRDELFLEVRLQILPSGMSYERSTSYNRLVLELILVPLLELKKSGYEVPQDVWYRIEQAFNFIQYTIKPDGEPPIIGDQDNGRLLPFGVNEHLNFRYLLSLGAILFDRADFKSQSNGYNIYCEMLAENGYGKFSAIDDESFEVGSANFPDAGFYVMRQGGDFLLFNASGKGKFAELNPGTHTHSDLLSVDLMCDGESIVIDSGSYLYTADAASRMLFRSTESHSTVTIDNLSQNNLKKELLWGFERNAIPTVLKWQSNADKDIVQASHSGYERLREAVTHTRKVEFVKRKCSWKITDELVGEGKHRVDINFILDPQVTPMIVGEKSVEITTKNGKLIRFDFESEKLFDIVIENIYISRGYGSKEQSKRVSIKADAEMPFKFETLITKI